MLGRYQWCDTCEDGTVPPDTKRTQQLGMDLPLFIPSAQIPAHHLLLEPLLAYCGHK